MFSQFFLFPALVIAATIPQGLDERSDIQPPVWPQFEAASTGTSDSSSAGSLITRRNDTANSLGDSFSAGHGAGKFLTTSSDGQDNICARSDGSYPHQLAQFSFTHPATDLTDFYACTGNVLSNIAGQVSKLGTRKLDMATLSISGNDFGFGEVVTRCVYPITSIGANYQANCDQALQTARDLIAGTTVWANYRDAVHNVLASLNGGAHVYITGYPQFFNTEPRTADFCDSTFFLDVAVIGRNLLMRAANRQAMNDLVLSVNENIKSQVADQISASHFVDIDRGFNGHRFCEPAFGNDPQGLGAHAEDVWFNDLKTTLEETGKWDGPPPDDLEASSWDAWAANIPSGFNDPSFQGRGLFDKFQQTSAFHPKALGHKITAAAVLFPILLDSQPDDFVKFGPSDICVDSGLSLAPAPTCVHLDADCAALTVADNFAFVICANVIVPRTPEHEFLDFTCQMAHGPLEPTDGPTYVQKLLDRDEFKRKLDHLLAELDLDALAFPDVQIPAPKHIDATNGRFPTCWDFPVNTLFASQARLPAITVPAGFTQDGLPVELELVGMEYQEQALLELASGVESVLQARRAPPAPL
ncbi:hypothetical protein LTR15_010340 [Elasticomyces elasticus]|nr:hypothetical protein LTR15_010340 [Elasticomyces elasticus]